MPIFNTPYDTSVGQGFKSVADKASKQIQVANIKNSFADVNRKIANEDFGGCINPAATVLTNNSLEESAVENFPLPLLVDSGSKGSESNSYLVFDARPFTTGTQLDEAGQLKVKLRTEYDFNKLVTILSAFWMTGKYNDFRYLSKVGMAAYGGLISESISRRFGLDPADQLMISVVACAFYANLFNESKTLTEQQKLQMTPNISQATYAKPQMIFDTLDKITELGKLEDLVEAIKVVTENPRLNDLNVGLVVTLISSSWFGVNGKAIITAGLEYPPIWVSCLYTAFTERSFKNSGLSKVIDRYRGNKGETEFSRGIKGLVTKAKTSYN